MSTITAEATQQSPAVEITSKRVTPQQLERLASRVVSTAGNDPMQIEQPFTGKPLGTVPKCGPDDVRAAIERARAAQAAWAQTSFAERKRVLMRYHDLVLNHEEELLDLLQIESGKARRHAFEEVLDVAITSRYYANTAEEHLK
ncbi:MAG: succinate-semialdehyde dehydrogenase / glutarate-semialdehyde dehydrogenase, partial [Thermoleophilaceae bacterium]|nr:succinate-semialdehyde dehydrogenase / glutarate-semialdehyde dehydrogenase [Thermoleophilaceae bacterium]